MSRFHVCFQKDAMQCGIACLQMICVHYGKKYRRICKTLCLSPNRKESI